VLWLHGGIQQHLLDVIRIRQEHSQPVDADAPASRRRQAVLQRRAKVLVDRLRLVVTGLLVLGLVLEALTLHNRVVQLGIRVAQLFVAAEHLKALGQAWVISVA